LGKMVRSASCVGILKLSRIGTTEHDMNGLTATADQFSFSAGELSQQLLAHIQTEATGYWEHQFDRLADRSEPLLWNLGIAKGRVVYAGTRNWSAQSLLRVARRHIFNTRHALVKPRFELIEVKVEERALTPAQLYAELIQARIGDEEQIAKAIETKILNDLDIYLGMGAGNARFLPVLELAAQMPFAGFEAQPLLAKAMHRQTVWESLKPQIPSMNLIPLLDPQMMAKAKIPAGQQQRIENLVKSGHSLGTIAEEMARDTLEIADMFAKLARVGLVRFSSLQEDKAVTIMAIDDSPLMLTQFERLVSALGYSVVVCQDAEKAIDTMLRVKPDAVFIDLNMPGISGFKLVEKIRRQPLLSATPIAILTGEQKVANRWRAQWSGCEFITKPLVSGAVQEFQTQLEELLTKLLATTPTATTKSNLHN
jgi:CheY-like chemotaxis protein